VWSDYFVDKEEADAEDREDLEKLVDKNSPILEEANRGEIAGLLEASNFVFIGLSSTGDVTTRPALARTLKTGEWYLSKTESKIFRRAEEKIKNFVSETIADYLSVLFQKEADKVFK
jgi:hypothetical protein